MKYRISEEYMDFCSVSYLCKNIVGLSRSQFYALLEKNIFPKPKTNHNNSRKYYTREQQIQCYKIRTTGKAANGSIYLFYNPRSENTTEPKQSPKNMNDKDPAVDELIHLLTTMGISATTNDINSALNNIYPKGYINSDLGAIARNLYKYLSYREIA